MAVYLLVGPVGAGKSTLARALERQWGALRLSIDEWMIRRHGQHMPRELFEAQRGAGLTELIELAERSAREGRHVVLDCGFWRRSERQRVRERLAAAGAAVELWYLQVDRDERWKRVAARNAALPDDSYAITRDAFDLFEPRFEPLGASEGARIVRPGDVEALLRSA